MADYTVLCLNDLRVGLPLAMVDQVVRAVCPTPLPAGPEIVLGVIDVHGRIAPVLDMRRRFRLPSRDIALTDRMVVVHTARGPMALLADAVGDIVEYAEANIARAEAVIPGLEFVEGIARLDDGLILIHNPDRFLSLDEAVSLDHALEQTVAG